MVSITLCYFVLVFFSPFSIAISSIEEEIANLSAFVRLFDLCLFGFVGFLFLLVSGRAAVCNCGTPWTFLLSLFCLYVSLILFPHLSFLWCLGKAVLRDNGISRIFSLIILQITFLTVLCLGRKVLGNCIDS